MPFYNPPDAPFGLTAHSASDGVFGFGRVDAAGVGVDLSGATTVVFEVQNASGAWTTVASKALGTIAWDAPGKAYVAKVEATVWPSFTAAVIPYRARDVWADGSDNVLAFGVITLLDR